MKTIALLSVLLASAAEAQTVSRKIPANMFPVKPVVSAPASGGRDLHIAQGSFFSYAMPDGWRVGEDGQYALTLVAPDNKAFTLMVGNSGLPPQYPPARFVQEKLMALRPQSLQISSPRPVAPAPGFQSAFQFDVSLVGQRGMNTRGVAKCNIATAYDTAVLAMTGAFSEASQWAGYSTWLPMVSDQVSATNGAAFGRRGVMAQNLRLSREYGEAAQRYRQWSQQNAKQVSDYRDATKDRQNKEFRENLGSTQPYTNPYDPSAPLDLPRTYQYFWVDRQGNVLGSNDPSANPNTGSTGDWRQMPRQKQ